MPGSIAHRIAQRASALWQDARRRWLPVSRADAEQARRDGKAEFDAMARLNPILAVAGATYAGLLEHLAGDSAADELLVRAATQAGEAGRALKLVAMPALESPRRQDYVAGVFAYAEALIAAIERQIVICRHLTNARAKRDLGAQLLLGAEQDQLLIGLLARENAFQNAAADAIRPANPQYFVTRARATLNTAMMHLLERPDPASQLSPPNLALVRREIEAAEVLLAKAAASAPQYYEWLTRHEDASGLANLASMRTALGALRAGLEQSIATEHAIASGTRALADAVGGAPSLAARLGHGPQPHATIAGLLVRRLSPAGPVRKS
jgi:hypothetical protein